MYTYLTYTLRRYQEMLLTRHTCVSMYMHAFWHMLDACVKRADTLGFNFEAMSIPPIFAAMFSASPSGVAGASSLSSTAFTASPSPLSRLSSRKRNASRLLAESADGSTLVRGGNF